MRRTARAIGPLLVLLLALVGMAAISSPPATAAPGDPHELDATFDANQDDGGRSSVRFAQTFTAKRTGSLDQVDLKLFRQSTQNPTEITVEIRETVAGGSPGPTVLGTSAAVSTAGIPQLQANAAWLTFGLTTPAQVTAGKRYAIVLLNPGFSAAPGGSKAIWVSTFADEYADGQAFRPGFGVGWDQPEIADDFYFRTYVVPGSVLDANHVPAPSGSGFGDPTLGQSFTALTTGELDQVDLYLFRTNNPPTTTFTVEIRNLLGTGLPGDTVLGTASTSVTAGAAPAYHRFVFADPISVATGVKYAIVLKNAGFTQTSSNFLWQIGGEYAGGEGLYSPGGVWKPLPFPADFSFKTYLVAAPDSDEDGFADPDDNCPEDANPAQTDTDVDGQGDACDETPKGDPIVVTVTAPSPSYPYAAAIPASFTPTYSGYQSGQGPDVAPTCTSTASTGSLPGTYPVTCSGGTAAVAADPDHDYVFGSYQAGTLTVLAPPCSDGVDNDGNGATDYPQDLGCTSALDTTEASAITCATTSRTGGGGLDILFGTSAADKIFGAGGDDSISGYAANDCLYGEAGNDGVYGGADRDLLHGGIGNDTVWGEDGNDELYGGTGNDWLDGGFADDLLNGGAGTDTLWGGFGNDRIVAADGTKDTVDCGFGTDVAIVDAIDTVIGCETKIVTAAP